MLHKISLFLKNNTSLYKQKFIKMSKENFISALQTGYTSKGDFITLGAGMLEGETIAETPINIPFAPQDTWQERHLLAHRLVLISMIFLVQTRLKQTYQFRYQN